MLIPIVITASILGGLFAFAPRVGEARTEPAPTRVVPSEKIPAPLRDQMQRAIVALPPNLQGQLPPTQWGDPSAWIRLAQQAPQNAPELNAIANALKAIPLPSPTPTPLGQVVIPSAIGTELTGVLNGLLAQAPPLPPNVFPFPTTRSIPPQVVLGQTVDPNALLVLAQQVDAVLPGRPEPARLRDIAARLVPSTSAARPAHSTYEQIIRAQGGTVNPEMSNVLAFLQAQGNAPPPPRMSGLPARIGQDPFAECAALYQRDVQLIDAELRRRNDATWEACKQDFDKCSDWYAAAFGASGVIGINVCSQTMAERCQRHMDENGAWYRTALAQARRRYDDCVRVIQEGIDRAERMRREEAARQAARQRPGEASSVAFPRPPATGPATNLPTSARGGFTPVGSLQRPFEVPFVRGAYA